MSVMAGSRGVRRFASSWDAVAAALSSLCLIHCLLLPALAALGPALVVGHGPPWLHWALIAAAAPVSVAALVGGFAVHREPAIPALGLAGFAIMATGAALHGHEPLEAWLTALGGLTVAVSHLRNWQARQRV
ncbi:MAG: MerC domain-containing protein [Sphingomonadaceae bacterium]|uniref:MerC domain-containing protein n=1 Tax=Thermaurantiacus sp. TaxID=2820283 RepID=UPI00298EEEA3|nr:MerC domain-containing protein [Thermaurantiacus sp.]MCS6987629.1 MerC domain-containing protein [Sphingomonadaceae bacterium]MDW8415230.1 MerC domain-containing protein [Thermaurantiacus sp.]